MTMCDRLYARTWTAWLTPSLSSLAAEVYRSTETHKRTRTHVYMHTNNIHTYIHAHYLYVGLSTFRFFFFFSTCRIYCCVPISDVYLWYLLCVFLFNLSLRAVDSLWWSKKGNIYIYIYKCVCVYIYMTPFWPHFRALSSFLWPHWSDSSPVLLHRKAAWNTSET